jgi:hypothetical protein
MENRSVSDVHFRARSRSSKAYPAIIAGKFRIGDHAGRTAKLTPTTYASLKPEAFGRSAAMERYEASFPDAAQADLTNYVII